jgi:predicted amidohydrolase
MGDLPVCKGSAAQVANATKLGNVATMDRMMASAAAKGARIIVFAEGALGISSATYKKGNKSYNDGGGVAAGGLAEPIPEPLGVKTPIVPCDFIGDEASASPALVALSCSARKHKIVVVYDTGDLVKCAPSDPYNKSEYCWECPPEGFMRFNTQVALGEGGELLAKYHKTHRYLASKCIGDGHQQPGGQDPRYFDTSFGVRFGMMLCYDICFHTPGIELAVGEHNISDFVFSTHWENEEGPPVSLATAFFQSWSRGVGANLLAANQGMGLMHTGSGIYSHGQALASAWEPANPHDEALLIATVPKLHGQSKPNYAGGRGHSPKDPWGSGTMSALGPVFKVIEVQRNGGTYNATVTSSSPSTSTDGHGKGALRLSAEMSAKETAMDSFSCTVSFSTAAAPVSAAIHVATPCDYYALVGVNGSWISSGAGGLPARGCALYRIPSASVIAAGGVGKWTPWNVNGGKPLYRTPLNDTVPVDLGGDIPMTSLTLRGSFQVGDIVRPMLAGKMGRALGEYILVDNDGRGFSTRAGGLHEPLTQAMLLVNSHESVPASAPAPAPPPTPDKEDEQMWGATGCSAPFSAVPVNVQNFWRDEPASAAGDMYAYCEVTLNGTASALQKRICGSVPSHKCTLQAGQ